MSNRLFIAFMLLCQCTLVGCAPAFIAAGAGAGYLATHERSRYKVQRFFHDLSRSIKQTTRKVYDEQWTSQHINYEQSKGFVLKISKVSLSPQKVAKGGKVKLVVEYVIMGGPEQGVKIEEKQTLLCNGEELTVLNNESTTKENGTWEDTLTFAVPDSAEPGKYVVVQEMKAQGLTRSTRRAFTVQ